MTDRYFEEPDHVSLYSAYRPSYPQYIYDIIVDYLKEKVIVYIARYSFTAFIIIVILVIVICINIITTVNYSISINTIICQVSHLNYLN